MALENAISRSDLFRDLDLPFDACAVKRYNANAILKDVDGIIGFIIEGSIGVINPTVDGNDIYMSTLSIGECFGISNLFSASKMRTILKCLSDVEVIIITKDKFMEFCRENSELSIRFAKICNQKIDFLLHRINHLTMQSANKRLITYLLENCNDGQVILENREKLASFLGMSRATLFREIALLKDEGLIEVKRNVCIIDKNKLEESYKK